MELEKKLKVGNIAEAQDYPEDRLQDVLAAVRVKIEQVSLQSNAIENQNSALEDQIKQALAQQAKLHNQGREMQNSITTAKVSVSQMQDEKLDLKR